MISPRDSDVASVPDAGPVRVLSLSTVFPSPREPGLGLFVQSRLRALAKLVDLRIVAPVPVIDYSSPERQWLHLRRAYPVVRRTDLTVVYPRWVYPPGGTPINIACLFIRLLPLLLKLRRGRAFDVIDAHFGYPEGVVAALVARVFRVPFAITLRGSEIPFATHALRRRMMQWALPQASVIFTVSEPLREFALECGVPAARIRKVPNGVDSAVFQRRPQAHMRAKFDIPAQRKVIVSAGELIAAKGHHRVIQELPALLAAGIDTELFIAGGVARGGYPFDKEIRACIDKLHLQNRVRMLGWVPRETLAELLAAADIFCLASDTEGWPNVVHEALSCGTPVVVTCVGAVAEMIPNEELGFIVPVGDQVALGAALRRALSSEWNRDAIAEWGRSRSWDRVAEEVYVELKAAVDASARDSVEQGDVADATKVPPAIH